ncbi:MAG: hypothetical protein HND40_13665 [Ignavibacteriota bacterium]|nr:hypothetical protein [Ignavibacterium album]MCZ2269483.1 hypothetical protein [Ignavibacteriales bacterium]QKK00543.1 MAG: hypothetical protein HND40_13665 [Ignavibacteriota bacterium]HOJ07838.1 hypothetical protein [Ignavibacteriaceae bacterium]
MKEYHNIRTINGSIDVTAASRLLSEQPEVKRLLIEAESSLAYIKMK